MPIRINNVILDIEEDMKTLKEKVAKKIKSIYKFNKKF